MLPLTRADSSSPEQAELAGTTHWGHFGCWWCANCNSDVMGTRWRADTAASRRSRLPTRQTRRRTRPGDPARRESPATLLRPGISALRNGGEHGQQLVRRQREGGQRAGLQFARQIAVVRPVAALQGKDDRQGVADGIRGFEPRSESVAVAQTFQRAVEAVGVRPQSREDDGEATLFRDAPLLVDQRCTWPVLSRSTATLAKL